MFSYYIISAAIENLWTNFSLTMAVQSNDWMSEGRVGSEKNTKIKPNMVIWCIPSFKDYPVSYPFVSVYKAKNVISIFLLHLTW